MNNFEHTANRANYSLPTMSVDYGEIPVTEQESVKILGDSPEMLTKVISAAGVSSAAYFIMKDFAIMVNKAIDCYEAANGAKPSNIDAFLDSQVFSRYAV